MLDKFREWVFRIVFRHQQLHKSVFPHWDNARSILILYESDIMERNNEIKAFRDELLQSDKDVVLLGFVDKKEPQTPYLPQSRMLSPRDFNILGMLKEEVIHDIQKREYDILFNLSQNDILPLRYVTMYAHAHFKAGKNSRQGEYDTKTDNQLLDLMIDMPAEDSARPLFEQLIHYIKTIRSND